MMGDPYDPDADTERSRELLASLPRDYALIATELMAISFRAGKAHGMTIAARALA